MKVLGSMWCLKRWKCGKNKENNRCLPFFTVYSLFPSNWINFKATRPRKAKGWIVSILLLSKYSFSREWRPRKLFCPTSFIWFQDSLKTVNALKEVNPFEANRPISFECKYKTRNFVWRARSWLGTSFIRFKPKFAKENEKKRDGYQNKTFSIIKTFMA